MMWSPRNKGVLEVEFAMRTSRLLWPPLASRSGEFRVGVYSREANNTGLFIVEKNDPTCLNYGTRIA